MILETLTLRDFGLFRGTQTFDLAPAPAGRNPVGRPIVLFGGNNGAGKTTVFDAVQLVLYGPRARCSKRGELSYDEFLRQSIHHAADEGDGARIALAFRVASGGEEHLYEVRRTWRVLGGKLREDVRVFQDGLPDRSLTERWAQFVEELVPLEVSQLFFFDAEKIRALAEDETSSQVLGTAVKSLLGLDIVERLIADVGVLQKTRLAQSNGPAEAWDEELGRLERDVDRLRGEVDALQLQRSELENLVQRARVEQRRAEETFAAAGGRHWEARAQRDKQRVELTHSLKECEHRLVALAGTELPLALVSHWLDAVRRQDAQEHEAAEAAIVARTLAERDRGLIEQLAGAHAPAKVLRLAEQYLEADRQARATVREVEPRLALTDGARSLLRHVMDQRIEELRNDAQALVRRHAEAERGLQHIQDEQTRLPDDEPIRQLLERHTAATTRWSALVEEAKRLDAALAARKLDWAECRGKLQALQAKGAKEDFARDDRRRMVQMVLRTKGIMHDFLQRATERKIERLSELITESFRFLLRKQTMVERIAIDPGTFAITLFDDAERPLAKQRLSEGEKQIFAIAVLWGLARASARPLPAIIDTPMARLDAVHRSHLVERYFPHASHQVIILSTDTEVDRHYYAALAPHVARAYHLSYSETARATIAEEGYFWKDPSGECAAGGRP